MRRLLLSLCLATTLCGAATLVAEDTYEQRLAAATKLVGSDAPNAVPELQALLKVRPDDAKTWYWLGYAYFDQGLRLDSGPPRQALMKEARAAFAQSKAHGNKEPIIDTCLAAINEDGSENKSKLSSNQGVEAELQLAETAFGRHDYDEAGKHYRAALALDPTHYLGTVWLGDCYFGQENYPEALVWYEKAAALDPNRETSYRYAGDALLRLGRPEEALEHYLSAVIAEPTKGQPFYALEQAGKRAGLDPRVPAADLPRVQIERGAKGPELKLSGPANALVLAYGLARVKWQEENLSRKFPAGTPYRLSLEEESSALRAMLKVYAELKDSGRLTAEQAKLLQELGPALDELAAIDRAELLDAHIAFTRLGRGSEQEYSAYREHNREKLRLYLKKYYLRQF